MEKRYTALRIIGTVYKIIGVIVGILTLLAVVFVLVVQPAVNLGFGFRSFTVVAVLFTAILTFIGGGLSALGIYAVGELIFLLINIEENTRYTALILRDRMLPPRPVQPVPPQPPNQAQVPPPYQPPPPPPEIPPSQEQP